MSRRRTKQRRSAQWREEWCRFVRETWAKRDPVLDDIGAGLMADYSEELQRREPRAGLGRRIPGGKGE